MKQGNVNQKPPIMDVFDTNKLDQVKETNFAKNFEVVEVNKFLHGFEIRHKKLVSLSFINRLMKKLNWFEGKCELKLLT